MDKIRQWFALKSISGIGNLRIKRLIDRFKTPDGVFNASDSDLFHIDGMSEKLVRAIRKHTLPDDMKRELDLLSKSGYSIITLEDNDYPPLLREIPDPPPLLYVYGELTSFKRMIAVVGTRNHTAYGANVAEHFSKNLVTMGLTIVSGMARGIDSKAHWGALSAEGTAAMKTIAVMGSGFNSVYPKENIKLFHKIAEQGAVLSEFSLNTEPEAFNFPLRNRVIAGMSLGVLVIEAAVKSGSLITARFALEQNRDVFAVPGSIFSGKSKGVHKLIKEGARLVDSPMEIAEELNPIAIMENPFPDSKPERNLALTPEESMVYYMLEPYPIHIDDLIRKITMEHKEPVSPGKISGLLFQLELKGLVHQSSGKFFSACEDIK